MGKQTPCGKGNLADIGYAASRFLMKSSMPAYKRVPTSRRSSADLRINSDASSVTPARSFTAAQFSAVDLAGQTAGADTLEIEALLAAAEADPKNHQARFDLGMAYFAADQREEAGQAMLDIIAADRTWNEEGARTQLLKFFEAWGPMDDASKAARRGLSSILFS